MNIRLWIGVFSFSAMLMSCHGPSEVQVKKGMGGYVLLKNGKTFAIKGAGCEFGDLKLLANDGANTVRTWRVDNGVKTGEQLLDEAKKDGLMVLMGLELEPERQGFDYNDTLKVRLQKESVCRQVMRLKNHPSLLAWGIGNELNLNYHNPKVWNAVNDIAIMIHHIDPHHPVTTMLAGIDKSVIDQVKERCPNLDFLSVQTYGDLINLQTRIKDSGFLGPYMVTEWGVTGHWEVPSTEWKAPIEQTGSEKAAFIHQCYLKAIRSDSLHCIGNFIFVWEQKQERTPTWYGLFCESGEQTESIDVMSYIWNGKWPENRCPSVSDMTINGKSAIQNCYVYPGEQIKVSINASDPENDLLQYHWEILPESKDLKAGGDKEGRPETIVNVTTASGKTLLIAPSQPGAYRLFVYVLDGHNHAGTANIPFYVK